MTMQHSNTCHLIFSVPQIIAYLSQIMSLEAGEVISTGTPAGVGVLRQPPVFLKAGDRVEIYIEHIGVLVNSVSAGTK
jgi:acylpyruvate hydrolase